MSEKPTREKKYPKCWWLVVVQYSVHSKKKGWGSGPWMETKDLAKRVEAPTGWDAQTIVTRELARTGILYINSVRATRE